MVLLCFLCFVGRVFLCFERGLVGELDVMGVQGSLFP